MTQDHAAKPDAVDPYLRSPSAADPNFENFVSNWKRLRSRLTIFLGAGASVGAKNRDGQYLPTAFDLRNDVWRQFMLDDADKESFDPTALKGMTLEHAAAIAESRTGRSAVIEQVVSTFDCARPLWQHAVTPFLRPKAVFTVNFDELVEKGWRLQSGSFGVEELNLRYNSKADTSAPHTPLFKPHGTLQHANRSIGSGGLVISMFDYFEMIGDYRDMIEKFLLDFDQSCVLFIGYSFGDMDICSELFRLRRKRNVPWYAVFPRDDSDVRRMYQDKFGVLQINKRFLDFVVELDQQVGFIPDEWKFDRLATIRASEKIQ
ncbi:SIR2 family protein [Mesorhizobium sp. B2-3-10]|uniref:SIR2 family NAD-dependent protein deacylase n=1 Tax=Mesorhizobium sp. B2-3-10 TaxID=2589954 RepID=UPI001FED6087|nr:SIR2 family protein [Mesorhizobium sp. B2-3-10]